MMGRLDAEFDRFVETASPALLRLAFVLTGDRGAAEDLLQTALLRTARRWRKASQAPETFVRRVLVNLAKDRWRMLRRRPAEVMATDSVPPELLAAGEFTDQVAAAHALLRALRQLPRGQRTVLALRYWEDLSVTDTAEALACTPGTVKSQTHRALAHLERLLADTDFVSSAAPKQHHQAPTARRAPIVMRQRAVARPGPDTTG